LQTTATALLFPADPCGFYFTTVPRSLASSSSSSRALAVSTESIIDPNPSDPPQWPDNLPRVSCPFRDTSKKNLLTGEFSTARLCSVLSVSHALDGLLLFLPCKLVSSCNHVWDSPFRVFPRCLSRPPRRRSMPSCRLTPLVSPKGCPFDSNSWSPAYRALLQTAIRC